MTYIPVLGHSNQLQALKHAVQLAKLLRITLLIPRFYAFSSGHSSTENQAGSVLSRPSAKYSEIYDLKLLKKFFYKHLAEVCWLATGEFVTLSACLDGIHNDI